MQNPMPNTDLPICSHKIPGNSYTYAEDGSGTEVPRTNVSELPGALTPRCLLQEVWVGRENMHFQPSQVGGSLSLLPPLPCVS